MFTVVAKKAQFDLKTAPYFLKVEKLITSSVYSVRHTYDKSTSTLQVHTTCLTTINVQQISRKRFAAIKYFIVFNIFFFIRNPHTFQPGLVELRVQKL
jgi:hypothetical protein